MNVESILEQIKRALQKQRPDWIAIEEAVSSLGDSINEKYDEENSLLSEVTKGVRFQHGEDSVRLTELFLKHGFDVNANDGFNGVSCLIELCWACYDHYILRAAELIFERLTRFDCRIGDEVDNDGILDAIEWKEGSWVIGDYDTGNLFETYHQMAERAIEGKPFKGIRAFEECKGLKVTKVCRIKKDKAVEDDDIGKGLIIWCGDIPLVAKEEVEFLIDPYCEEMGETEDVSDLYESIIGKTVKSLFYLSQTCARLYFAERSFMLFDRVIFNGDAMSRQSTTRCIIHATGQKLVLKKGLKVKRILMDSGFNCSPSCKMLNRPSFYLVTEDGLYYLSAHDDRYADGILCTDRMPQTWEENLTRQICYDDAVVDETEYEGKKLRRLHLKSNVGYITFQAGYGPCSQIECYITEDKMTLPFRRGSEMENSLIKIRLSDVRRVRNIRFLAAGHRPWNEIEIWADWNNIVHFKTLWKENLERNRRKSIDNDQKKVHPEMTISSGISDMSLYDLTSRLDGMAFESWFREDNTRATSCDEIVWWLFYDDGTGYRKERDHLDKPTITKEQMDEFVRLLEEIIKRSKPH